MVDGKFVYSKLWFRDSYVSKRNLEFVAHGPHTQADGQNDVQIHEVLQDPDEYVVT